MIVKAFILLSLVYNIGVLGETPTPPNPQQFKIHAGKPGSGQQYEVTTNWVDRLEGLFRIDVNDDERLVQQAFYFETQKIGFDIDYYDGSPKCTKTKENYADMLADWQKLPYSGKTTAISHRGLECNMWNQTDQSWTWSYLASVKGNIPVEILDNSILISIFTNYTVGPSAVPKHLFDLPVPVASCK